MARLLVKHGADVNAATTEGDTALMAAAEFGHAAVVRLLLDHGADVNAADRRGRTALDLAEEPHLQQLLVEAGGKTRPTSLFGVALAQATRPQLRQALAARAGILVRREDDRYWFDLYDSSGALEGSSELAIGYEVKQGGDRFAIAGYTFPSFMDVQQVERVKRMVASKYGPPDHSSGRVGLGPVSHRWHLPDGIEIEIRRGWPSTTTYLSYINPQALAAMEAQIDRSKRAQQHQQLQEQQDVF